MLVSALVSERTTRVGLSYVYVWKDINEDEDIVIFWSLDIDIKMLLAKNPSKVGFFDMIFISYKEKN